MIVEYYIKAIQWSAMWLIFWQVQLCHFYLMVITSSHKNSSPFSSLPSFPPSLTTVQICILGTLIPVWWVLGKSNCHFVPRSKANTAINWKQHNLAAPKPVILTPWYVAAPSIFKQWKWHHYQATLDDEKWPTSGNTVNTKNLQLSVIAIVMYLPLSADLDLQWGWTCKGKKPTLCRVCLYN